MKKKILFTLLTLALCLSLLPTAVFADESGGAATNSVTYLDASGTPQECTNYETVESHTGNVDWSGWYVVKEKDVKIDGTVTLTGETHLILCDGATLTINGGTAGQAENYGIKSSNNGNYNNLTIYGQTKGTGTLTVTAADAANNTGEVAASYGIYTSYGLTVNGGSVTATAGKATNSGTNGAESWGIYADNGLTVNGGSLTATGGTATSSGFYAESYGIAIASGPLTLSGGTVTGNSNAAASSDLAYSYGLWAGDAVTVTGGTLTGKAGTATVTSTGGGAEGKAGDIFAYASTDAKITISGGTFRGTLTLRSANIDPVLTGGSFEQLSWMKLIDRDDVVQTDLAALLGDSSAFQKTTGKKELVKRSEISGVLENVEVVLHTDHSETTQGLCDYCGRLFYLNESGVSTELTNYNVVSDGDSDVAWSSGWYVVTKDTTINGTVTMGQYVTVNLLLCDGATLTVNGGIVNKKFGENPTLKVYAQSNGSNTGKLKANGIESNRYGIYFTSGNLCVYGGSVTGTGIKASGYTTYGIGVKYLEVNNGTVTGNNNNTDNCYGVNASQLILKGGTVKGTGYHGVSAPTLTLTGGTLEGRGEYEGVYLDKYTISGGTFIADGKSYGISELNVNRTHDITGGTFTVSSVEGGLLSLFDEDEGGYAFSQGGTIVNAATATSLNKATVVKHTCDYTNLDPNSGKYSCACGRTNKQKTVWYQEYNTTTGKFEKTACDEYYVINENIRGMGTSGTTMWVVVEKDTAINGTLEFYGTINLILCDGATLTVSDGINANGNLTIYGEEKGTGKLAVTNSSLAPDVHSVVAIKADGCALTVHGGNMTATATADNASESYGILTYSFTVYGGSVSGSGGTAKGTIYSNSRGIAANNITVIGGTVNATGGTSSNESCGIYTESMTVNGGTVNATGGAASGSCGIYATNITVNNGTVTATGGNAGENGDSYGIYVTNMSVSGGTVNGTGGTANGSCGIYATNITVNDGTVTATGGTAEEVSCGIAAKNMTVSGGTLKLTKGSYVYTKLTVENAVTLADLLADGCAYKHYGAGADVEPFKLADLTSPLKLVKIVTHEHDYESGKCVYCGKAKPSSGGVSSTTTTTKKNEDGSTTTTKKDWATGTVTETTKFPDGSTTTIETKKDGTVTEMNTGVGGTTGTTVSNKDGNVSTNVSVSEKDAENGTVELPIDEVKPEEEREIDIDMPEGGATIEIPVENPTVGTVVVIVDEDGNETILPDTKLTKNGVVVTLSENCTIKVIDNSKKFVDIPAGAYYEDAVAWAYARGITGGTGADMFGPDAPCGRAQLVTFLWRAAGCPEAEGSKTFDDVSEDAYYTDAVKWAASLGIVGGYGNGLFGTDDAITREQMAVMLYRFAQAVGMDTTQDGMAVREYKDYESISDYAVTAIQWAVNTGVMRGYDGNLMPTMECSRAQIVTMLYRLLGN